MFYLFDCLKCVHLYMCTLQSTYDKPLCRKFNLKKYYYYQTRVLLSLLSDMCYYQTKK